MSEYVQVTHVSDSATSPAIAPDGKTLAFIRGPSTFFGPGQIYVKALPDGEPVQLTRDELAKMSPVFSPDGSRVAYTAVDQEFAWNTWLVPVVGGEPQPWLKNASGLSWTDPVHVLFSEITGTGIHMSVVMATADRADRRPIYQPADALGMAHHSVSRLTAHRCCSSRWCPTSSGSAALFRPTVGRREGTLDQKANVRRLHGRRMAGGCTSRRG